MFKLTGFIIAAFFLVAIVAPVCGGAETVTIGMYGVPSIKSVKPDTYQDQLEKAGINAVFVPDDEETIRWFKEKGYKVFISMNVFGGTGPWKKYPDSRPVKENGELLEEGHGGYGGICPTHEAWRKDRLDYIESVLKRFGGKEGIDGIWLDFIRYPGMWEAAKPDVPDTCYCKRCLSKYFNSVERGAWSVEVRAEDAKLRSYEDGGKDSVERTAWSVEVRAEDAKMRSCDKTEDAKMRRCEDGKEATQSATNTSSTHPHIHTSTHPPITNYEWMVWKKKQITSFVIEAKRIIDRYSKERPIKLGLFIVPWTKGERQNDISFKIAQDAFELSKHVDVISPMVYHKMCAQDESWVRRMTEYYKETASCEVWPIVQSHDCEQGEFTNVVRYAGEAGADGILVYSFGGMKPDFWKGLKAFRKPENLLGDDSVERRASEVRGQGEEDEATKMRRCEVTNHSITQSLSYSSRKTFNEYYLRDEYVRKPLDAIGVKADYGREGKWEAALPKCTPGREYLFTGLFYRDTFENGVYANVSVWGQRFRINEHLWAGVFQPIRVHVTCPDKITDNTFKFINNNPGTTFYMAKPGLIKDSSQFTVHSSRQGVEGKDSGERKNNLEFRIENLELKNENPSARSEEKGGERKNNLEFRIENLELKNELQEEVGAGDSVERGAWSVERRDSTEHPNHLVTQSLSYSSPITYHSFFPIGVYGATLNNLEEIKKIGINTVIIGGRGEELRKLIQECRRLDLKYVLSVPHDPDALHVYLDEIREGRGRDSVERRAYSVEGKEGEGKNNLKLRIKNEELENTKELPSAFSLQPSASNLLGFYVNDEPEIVSFPMNKAQDIQRLIKDRFPEAATYMAVVRPQKVRDYASASDFFMMDQYPVPSMPMVWLSDSMDEAAVIVGRERIVSVIQAFGGGEEAKHGWPRLPTRQEIECLTFLSIIHGSRGVFYFTFSEIGKTEKGRNDLAYVVGRLNKVGEWLSQTGEWIKDYGLWIKEHGAWRMAHGAESNLQPSPFNLQPAVAVDILSPYGMDQDGRPAIHAAIKKKGSQRLLMAVNVIGTSVEALIHTNIEKTEAAREIFSENIYSVIGGAIQSHFKPYEVKVFVMDEEGN